MRRKLEPGDGMPARVRILLRPKGKIVPEKAWVDEIAQQAKENSIPVFMKESLREIMGEDFRQEYPWKD